MPLQQQLRIDLHDQRILQAEHARDRQAVVDGMVEDDQVIADLEIRRRYANVLEELRLAFANEELAFDQGV